MSIEKIGKILDLHYVAYKILNGRIYADVMILGTKPFEQVEDMTEKSPSEIYEWLGY